MDLQTHGIKKYPTSALLASSADLGWSTILAELRSHGVCETPIIVPQHMELCLAIDGNHEGLVIRSGAGQRQETKPTTGTIWLSPVGVGDNTLTITAPIQKTLHLYLPTTPFDRLRDEFNLPAMPARSLRYVAGIRDSVIEQIGRSVISEMITETSVGRMLVATASLMLAAHLIHSYQDSGFGAHASPFAHALDHARLRRVLDYISTHLDDEITLASLASSISSRRPPAWNRSTRI
jgi:AraC family transcriptional regulator